MKKHNLLTVIVKVFAMTLLLTGTHAALLAQISVKPIGGAIYGQAVVACSNGSDYDYVATSTTIYARPDNEDIFYLNVFTAPAGYSITGFSNKKDNTGSYRAVSLTNTQGYSYLCYNKVNAPFPDAMVTGPVALPLNGGTILAGAALYNYTNTYYGAGLYASFDNGQTWLADTLGLNLTPWSGEITGLSVDNNQNLYLVGPQGLFKQLPNSTGWTLVNGNPAGDSLIQLQSLFIDAQNRMVAGSNNYVYDFANNTYLSYLYISNDTGLTFYADSINSPYSLQDFVSDNAGNLYAWQYNSIYREVAGTIGNWALADSAFLASGVGTPTCFSAGSSLTLGSNLGIFTSTNGGGSWASTNNGISDEDIYSIITQPNGRQLCTTDLGIFYKDPFDILWQLSYPYQVTSNSSSTVLNLYNDNEGNIYAVPPVPTPGCVIPNPVAPLKSTNNGLTWITDSAGFSAVGGSGFYIDELGTRHFYNAFSTFSILAAWSSQQGSATICPDTAGLPTFGWGGGMANMCSDKHGYLYACVHEFDWTQEIIYRRPLNGTIWTADTAGLGPIFAQTPKMASGLTTGLIVSNGSQIFHKAAEGWDTVQVPDGLPVTGISVDDNGVIFMAAPGMGNADSGAVYYTNNNGNTWQIALSGIDVQSLVSIGTSTFVLTIGNWGFELNSLSTATGIKVTTVSEGIRAFPNPSSTGTWTVKTSDDLIDGKVEIRDINGRVVYHATLGTTNEQINAPELAAGTYVLTVINGEKTGSSLLIKQ